MDKAVILENLARELDFVFIDTGMCIGGNSLSNGEGLIKRLPTSHPDALIMDVERAEIQVTELERVITTYQNVFAIARLAVELSGGINTLRFYHDQPRWSGSRHRSALWNLILSTERLAQAIPIIDEHVYLPNGSVPAASATDTYAVSAFLGLTRRREGEKGALATTDRDLVDLYEFGIDASTSKRNLASRTSLFLVSDERTSRYSFNRNDKLGLEENFDWNTLGLQRFEVNSFRRNIRFRRTGERVSEARTVDTCGVVRVFPLVESEGRYFAVDVNRSYDSLLLHDEPVTVKNRGKRVEALYFRSDAIPEPLRTLHPRSEPTAA